MILTNTSIGNNGRLGNQLFQVAMLYGLAAKTGHEVRLPYWEYAMHFEHADKFKFITPYECKSFRQVNQHEHIYHFQDYAPVTKRTLNYNFRGYFQSEKYFVHVGREVRELFKPSQEALQDVQRCYPHLLSGVHKFVALHVRRGDYVKLNQYHYNLTPEYYHNAIAKFPTYYKIVVFSDDMQYARDMLSGYSGRIYFAKDLVKSDITDIFAMSLCDGHIIANSTFSWWGAYLSESSKLIVCPDRKDKWFGIKYKHLSTQDIYPEPMGFWVEI